MKIYQLEKRTARAEVSSAYRTEQEKIKAIWIPTNS